MNVTTYIIKYEVERTHEVKSTKLWDLAVAIKFYACMWSTLLLWCITVKAGPLCQSTWWDYQ